MVPALAGLGNGRSRANAELERRVAAPRPPNLRSRSCPDRCGYLAANEAEKAVSINLVELRFFGAFGRLYLGGTEAAIQEASAAALAALQAVDGRENKPEKRR